MVVNEECNAVSNNNRADKTQMCFMETQAVFFQSRFIKTPYMWNYICRWTGHAKYSSASQISCVQTVVSWVKSIGCFFDISAWGFSIVPSPHSPPSHLTLNQLVPSSRRFYVILTSTSRPASIDSITRAVFTDRVHTWAQADGVVLL